MRKETNIRKSNFKLYAIGIFSIVVILSIGIIYYNLIKGSNEKIDIAKSSEIENNIVQNNLIEQASAQIGKTVEEVASEKDELEDTTEKIAINTSMIDNKEKEEKNDVENEVSNEIEENIKQEEKEELVFCMPVDGEIIKEFAKDTLVYSTTLNEWTTHTGIDIKAEKTAIVKASEKGTVKYIKNDPRYGITIVIEHSDGYSTVYSNLLTSEFVVEGEKIEKGQTIGTVGNTAVFEIADESHLHFEILKDNIQVDPNLYLK